VTGCGCLLLVAALAGLLYVLIAGSTDPGEPIEQAAALAGLTALLLIFSAAASPPPLGAAAQAARSIGTRRGSHEVARS
jgi:hypothetical protein